jgi:hypothetical protein
VKGRVIVISGIDGSGKSTVIAELKKSLQQLGYSAYSPWLRYNHYLTKGVFVIAKLLGLYSYEIRNGRRVLGYHDFYRCRLISFLFIFTTFIDTFFASLVKIYIPVYVLRRTVICDRWVPDILIDVAIDTGKDKLEKNMIWKLFWLLVPNRAKVFVIMRNSHDVLTCREENRISRDFNIRFSMYNDLARLGGAHAVDNNGPVFGSVSQILDVLAP